LLGQPATPSASHTRDPATGLIIMYKLVSAMAILAHANAAEQTDNEHIRLLLDQIALSERRIAAEKMRIAEATDTLHAIDRDRSTDSKRRELGVGWQAYMNQGISTGVQYAQAAANGDQDFSQLSQDTSDNFGAINHAGEHTQQHNVESSLPADNIRPPMPVSSSTTAASASSASNNLHASIVDAVESSLKGPIQALTGVEIGRVPPPAADERVDKPARAGGAHTHSTDGSQSNELPHGHATWRDYMMAGIETGIAYASAAAGVAEGTSDPSNDFGGLSQQTSDKFSVLNHRGDAPYDNSAEQEAPSPQAHEADSAPSSSWGTAQEWGAPEPRSMPEEKAAPWQEYMNAGISTGVNYAEAGANSASGQKDPSVTFGELSQQTSGNFDTLNQRPPSNAEQILGAIGNAAPSSTQQVQPAGQMSEQVGTGESKAAGHATWHDYMWEGIKTGLAFANAGAGTASGEVDPSTEFGDLSQVTADHFSALNHQGEDQASSSAQPEPHGVRRRALFVDPQDRF